MNPSYNRYANHKAFASPGFANTAQPFSTPRSYASASPKTPPKMADIPADHLELYCLQTARSSRHSPFLFFQGIGIEDDDAWTQLEYFQQVVRLPFSIPFQPDHDFKGNAREDGHRNSTQKRLNLILSIQEPRVFATDWGLPLASSPDEIVHPYLVANCLTRKVREGEGGRLIAVSRAVSVQDTLIAQEHLHQWQPAGYFSGLDSTLNCCLGSLKVAVKATCISLLLADGKKDLARLAESHLDFTPVAPTRLKDKWLMIPKPILWFNTLEAAMAVVKRITIFAAMFSDYWDSDIVPMHPAYGLEFADQLIETLKREVRASSRFVERDYSQLNSPYDSGMHLSNLSDYGEDAIPPGFYAPLAPPNDDDEIMSETAPALETFQSDGEGIGPQDPSTDI
eukprot:g16944.t1